MRLSATRATLHARRIYWRLAFDCGHAVQRPAPPGLRPMPRTVWERAEQLAWATRQCRACPESYPATN